MYPSLSDLLHTKDTTNIGWHGGIIIAIFTVGWARGSILFGLLADRIGRAKTFLPASCLMLLHLDSAPSPLNGGISQFTVFLWDSTSAANAASVLYSFPNVSQRKEIIRAVCDEFVVPGRSSAYRFIQSGRRRFRLEIFVCSWRSSILTNRFSIDSTSS